MFPIIFTMVPHLLVSQEFRPAKNADDPGYTGVVIVLLFVAGTLVLMGAQALGYIE